MSLVLTPKFISFFNRTIVTKMLRNIIDNFFRKLYKMNRYCIHLDTLIVSQILRQNLFCLSKAISVIIKKCFFQFKIIALWEDGKKLRFKIKKISDTISDN